MNKHIIIGYAAYMGAAAILLTYLKIATARAQAAHLDEEK